MDSSVALLELDECIVVCQKDSSFEVVLDLYVQMGTKPKVETVECEPLTLSEFQYVIETLGKRIHPKSIKLKLASEIPTAVSYMKFLRSWGHNVGNFVYNPTSGPRLQPNMTYIMYNSITHMSILCSQIGIPMYYPEFCVIEVAKNTPQLCEHFHAKKWINKEVLTRKVMGFLVLYGEL